MGFAQGAAGKLSAAPGTGGNGSKGEAAEPALSHLIGHDPQAGEFAERELGGQSGRQGNAVG